MTDPPQPLVVKRGRPPTATSTAEIRDCARHGAVEFHRYQGGQGTFRYRCVVNLHFHHVDPSQKRFAVNTALGKSLDAFREEARRCVLVCANCHGEIEAGLIGSPPVTEYPQRDSNPRPQP